MGLSLTQVHSNSESIKWLRNCHSGVGLTRRYLADVEAAVAAEPQRYASLRFAVLDPAIQPELAERLDLRSIPSIYLLRRAHWYPYVDRFDAPATLAAALHFAGLSFELLGIRSLQSAEELHGLQQEAASSVVLFDHCGWMAAAAGGNETDVAQIVIEEASVSRGSPETATAIPSVSEGRPRAMAEAERLEAVPLRPYSQRCTTDTVSSRHGIHDAGAAGTAANSSEVPSTLRLPPKQSSGRGAKSSAGHPAVEQITPQAKARLSRSQRSCRNNERRRFRRAHVELRRLATTQAAGPTGWSFGLVTDAAVTIHVDAALAKEPWGALLHVREGGQTFVFLGQSPILQFLRNVSKDPVKKLTPDNYGLQLSGGVPALILFIDQISFPDASEAAQLAVRSAARHFAMQAITEASEEEGTVADVDGQDKEENVQQAVLLQDAPLGAVRSLAAGVVPSGELLRQLAEQQGAIVVQVGGGEQGELPSTLAAQLADGGIDLPSLLKSLWSTMAPHQHARLVGDPGEAAESADSGSGRVRNEPASAGLGGEVDASASNSAAGKADAEAEGDADADATAGNHAGGQASIMFDQAQEPDASFGSEQCPLEPPAGAETARSATAEACEADSADRDAAEPRDGAASSMLAPLLLKFFYMDGEEALLHMLESPPLSSRLPCTIAILHPGRQAAYLLHKCPPTVEEVIAFSQAALDGQLLPWVRPEAEKRSAASVATRPRPPRLEQEVRASDGVPRITPLELRALLHRPPISRSAAEASRGNGTSQVNGQSTEDPEVTLFPIPSGAASRTLSLGLTSKPASHIGEVPDPGGPPITADAPIEAEAGLRTLQETSSSEPCRNDDVAVLFTSPGCGFCQRAERVFREIHRAMGLLLAQKDGPYVPAGLTALRLQLVQVECFGDRCQSALVDTDMQQLELGDFPSLVLFGGSADHPAPPSVYAGQMSVRAVMDFLAHQGSSSLGLLKVFEKDVNSQLQSMAVPVRKRPVVRGTKTKQGAPVTSATEVPPETGCRQLLKSGQSQGVLGPAVLPPRGSLLVATEALSSSWLFSKTVVLILDSGDQPAGVILNRQLTWQAVQPLLQQPLRTALEAAEASVFLGGPVGSAEPGGASSLGVLTLKRGMEGFSDILPNLSWADVDQQGLSRLNEQSDPVHFVENGAMSSTTSNKDLSRYFFQRCMWAPGQLQDEIRKGMWAVASCASSVIFPLSGDQGLHCGDDEVGKNEDCLWTRVLESLDRRWSAVR
eukprot:SM000080S22916  [mRNA]  locus=s80:124631:129274:+ [translate_table: standard]